MSTTVLNIEYQMNMLSICGGRPFSNIIKSLFTLRLKESVELTQRSTFSEIFKMKNSIGWAVSLPLPILDTLDKEKEIRPHLSSLLSESKKLSTKIDSGTHIPWCQDFASKKHIFCDVFLCFLDYPNGRLLNELVLSNQCSSQMFLHPMLARLTLYRHNLRGFQVHMSARARWGL